MMKVVKFVFQGLKATILDIMCRLNAKMDITILAKQLSGKIGVTFDSNDEKLFLDRIIRTMIECNVIHLSH